MEGTLSVQRALFRQGVILEEAEGNVFSEWETRMQ